MNPIQSSSMYNLSSTLFSGYAAINNVRLTQALTGKTGVSPVPSVKSVLSSDSTVFLKDYQNQMADMLTKAGQALNPKGAGKTQAGSGDSAVAEASGQMAGQSDSYVLKVEQLASGQMNRSQAMESGGALPTMSGRLVIRTEQGSAELFLSSAGAKTNQEALTNFASSINSANTGVTAKVVTKDGKSSLELTGGDKDFSVSGSLGERLGLDQVATERKDAVYTVAKNGGAEKRMTSSTNDVTVDGALKASLKGVGQTTLAAGQSSTQLKADAMEAMVKSFNSTLKFLNDNADQGTGVLSQMKRMLIPGTSEKSMSLIGITSGKDGTLSFDKAKFTEAMKKDPSMAGGIADSVARGIQSDAKAGMQQSSQSLVSQSAAKTVGTSSSKSSYDMDTINFLSSYNRQGVFNTMNLYAVGALMNISV